MLVLASEEIAMPAVCAACGAELKDESQTCLQCAGKAADTQAVVDSVSRFVPSFQTAPGPEGIGGWLILVAIGLVLNPVFFVMAMMKDLHFLDSSGRGLIEHLVPGVTLLTVFELVMTIVMMVTELILVVLFFKEKRAFPRYYQIWLGAFLVFALAELTLCPRSVAPGVTDPIATNLVSQLTSALGTQLLRVFAVAVVWVWYFAVSRRVKATFVH